MNIIIISLAEWRLFSKAFIFEFLQLECSVGYSEHARKRNPEIRCSNLFTYNNTS